MQDFIPTLPENALFVHLAKLGVQEQSPHCMHDLTAAKVFGIVRSSLAVNLFAPVLEVVQQLVEWSV